MHKWVERNGKRFLIDIDLGPNSERHERGFIIKPRRMIKGNNRQISIGWCATFTYDKKSYKSGGYYHKHGAIQWACTKLDELGVDKLYI